MSEAACEARGVLVSLRKVSKKLFFGDLECAEHAAGALSTVELVFKDGVWCGGAAARA
jgi:hypothetical protein